MGIELKQSLRLSQQLVMTPQLQQAIKLLQLNRMELLEMVNQELVENPILEESQDESEAPSGDVEREEGDTAELAPGEVPQDPEMEQKRDEESFQETANSKEDINWEQYIEEFNSNNQPTTPSMKEINEDLPSFENALTKTSTLEDHLIWQLSMTALSEKEKILGELIIGNLGNDGYLLAPIEDLAKEAEIEVEDAEELLKLMRTLDPVGVCSRNLRECLLAQAAFLTPRQPLVEKLISDHMGLLEKKNYPAIAKLTGESLDAVITATKIILEFEPKPGSSFAESDAHYITPDIYVYKVGTEYVISLNEDGMPKLRVSPYYKGLLSKGRSVTPNQKAEREYIQDKLRSALWLIRSIHNRQKTIYKVTEAIVTRQKDFFEKGVHQLKPMILKDIASDIGMHESTISRVTTNKYVHTPVGIFELKYFFNSSINSTDGSDSLASEAVKEKIKGLISKEDPKNPLSDQRIVELLKSNQIDIARRTVAKYREMLGILSSSKRKKVF